MTKLPEVKVPGGIKEKVEDQGIGGREDTKGEQLLQGKDEKEHEEGQAPIAAGAGEDQNAPPVIKPDAPAQGIEATGDKHNAPGQLLNAVAPPEDSESVNVPGANPDEALKARQERAAAGESPSVKDSKLLQAIAPQPNAGHVEGAPDDSKV